MYASDLPMSFQAIKNPRKLARSSGERDVSFPAKRVWSTVRFAFDEHGMVGSGLLRVTATGPGQS
jgi:hypothetical protein